MKAFAPPFFSSHASGIFNIKTDYTPPLVFLLPLPFFCCFEVFTICSLADKSYQDSSNSADPAPF